MATALTVTPVMRDEGGGMAYIGHARLPLIVVGLQEWSSGHAFPVAGYARAAVTSLNGEVSLPVMIVLLE